MRQGSSKYILVLSEEKQITTAVQAPQICQDPGICTLVAQELGMLITVKDQLH